MAPFPHGAGGVCNGIAACVPTLALGPASCSSSVVLESSPPFTVTEVAGRWRV